MHDKMVIPKLIVLALADYFAISAFRGRIKDMAGGGRVRWVYRSEQPAKFWACTLGWGIGFATFLLMLQYGHSARINGTVGAIGFVLASVIFIWSQKL